MRVRLIFYELLLWLGALLVLPKALYDYAVRKKYRHSFWQRCGYNFPDIEKRGRRLIWLHAVSVGEVKAAAPLAKLLKDDGDPLLLVSTVTETGLEEAKRSIPAADYCVYLPFDFYRVIGPIVLKVRPDSVLLSEGDLWPNFIIAAKAIGASVAVVNGKISPRSLRRYQLLSFATRPLLEAIDFFALQSEEHRQRFTQLGIPNDKLLVTGNLKLDQQPHFLSSSEKDQLKAQLAIPPDRKVIVIASTHAPEEQLLLNALQGLWSEFPELAIVIVPRHPERFESVAALLASQHLPYWRYSNGAPKEPFFSTLILLDAMGKLSHCYQIADIAIVAGSYIDKIGGHNIIEPLWFGVPTLFGPYMHSQLDLVAHVQRYGAALQQPIEGLSSAVAELLRSQQAAEQLKEGAKKLVEEARGSSMKTFLALKKKKWI